MKEARGEAVAGADGTHDLDRERRDLMGACLSRLGRGKDAIEAYRKAVELTPEDNESLFWYAIEAFASARKLCTDCLSDDNRSIEAEATRLAAAR